VRSRPERAHIRQWLAKLGDIDPRALVVMTVRRHPPLLQPTPPVALDDADLVHAGLFEKRAVGLTGHASSRPELGDAVHTNRHQASESPRARVARRHRYADALGPSELLRIHRPSVEGQPRCRKAKPGTSRCWADSASRSARVLTVCSLLAMVTDARRGVRESYTPGRSERTPGMRQASAIALSFAVELPVTTGR